MNTDTRKALWNVYETHKHSLLLLYFCIYLPWFSYLERTVTTHFHVIHVPLDDYIPFCEFFIVPYLLWFAYIAVGFSYFYLRDREEYFRLCATLFTGMTVFLLVSSLYPNGHYLRPASFARDNIFVDMVRWLYATDTATNLFPSIHVYNSLMVNAAVWHSSRLKEKRIVRYGSAVLAASIILATMFLKQHSVFDVMTAFLMAAVMYSLVYVHNLYRFPAGAQRYRRKLKHIG